MSRFTAIRKLESLYIYGFSSAIEIEAAQGLAYCGIGQLHLRTSETDNSGNSVDFHIPPLYGRLAVSSAREIKLASTAFTTARKLSMTSATFRRR